MSKEPPLEQPDSAISRTKHLIRFEREIFDAIEAWRKRREKELPGMRISFNQAVNVLCMKAARKP